MRDFVLITETLHLLAGEVCFIVGDNGIGELELVYYVLPKKLDNLLPGDFGEWHYLDPFGSRWLSRGIITGVVLEGGPTMSNSYCMKVQGLHKA